MSSKLTGNPEFHRTVLYIERHSVYSAPHASWIRWTNIESDHNPTPFRFTSFPGSGCFTREQLNPIARWSVVESAVYADDSNLGPFVVPWGILSLCWKTRFKSEQVHPTIAVDDESFWDSLVQIYRCRVAPLETEISSTQIKRPRIVFDNLGPSEHARIG